jgi:predicted metal-binding protein
MNHPHAIFVCTTCGKNQQSDRKNDRSDGDRLLAQLQTLHQTSSLHSISIQPVKCMGVCEQDCAIALVSPGKRTYLFGNLPTDAARIESTAIAVLDCASQYQAKADGALAYGDRPELLKTRVLARIPPLPLVSAQEVSEESYAAKR